MKIFLIAFMILVGCTTQAAIESREWTFPGGMVISDLLGGDIPGTGSDWYICALYEDGTEIVDFNGIAMGFYAGYGYVLNGSSFSALENETVFLRYYNDVNESLATYYIDSDSHLLPDLEGIINPGDGLTSIAFTFGNSTWQAVPEPGTILLLIFGGIGTYLVRRNRMLS
ncbi:MAG: PEP-CTERM sorting domain-containing protein [Kiritimatiellales bacterium]